MSTHSDAPPGSDTQPIVALVTPNLYQLQGGPIHVTYSTTSIDGQPHFSYQDPHQTLFFKGDDIRVTDTPIGRLVTVVIRRTVDTGSTTFSVVIPAVNLEKSHSAHVSTLAITTVHRFSVIAAFNRGQTELYHTVALAGTAQFVYF